MSIKVRLFICILIQVWLVATLNAQQFTLRLDPSGEQEVAEGGSIAITCSADYVDAQNVRLVLYKNRENLDARQQESRGSTSITISHRIINANWDDAGEYLCQAVGNNQQVARQASLNLRIRTANSHSQNRKCEPTQRLCADNLTCKEKYWFCDGERDCPGGDDEIDCPIRRPGQLCESTQFECKSRRQCISKAYVCDKTQDCEDGSDEIGCSAPQVTIPPIRDIRVCVGETIVINCTAMGFYYPYINWRWNWGHICDSPRCCTSNSQGTGILTILNAQLSDSGAYSCEAINSLGREIYKHDAMVAVSDCNSTPPPLRQIECNRDGSYYPMVLETENCPCYEGYTGRTCSECERGFERRYENGRYVCRKTLPRPTCDQRGTRFQDPSGKCICFGAYDGDLCDRCKSTAYRHPLTQECISCFCNGLQVTCRGAVDLFYNRERANFQTTQHGWSVINRYKNVTSDEVNTNTRLGIFEYIGSSGPWFFKASQTFGGNRIASYGGELTFTIFYEGEPQYTEEAMKLEVRIEGAKIGVIYKHNQRLYPYEENKIVIKMVESSFSTYPDERLVTKDHMLMVLHNIELIMISASFVDEQHSASIREASFDYAKECNDPSRRPQEVAHLVEICQCPRGYNGTSCESCDSKYIRTTEGFYIGTCEIDCNILCNGHSTRCDTNKCYNCQHNTAGQFCQSCAPGYIGDATGGSENDCYRSIRG